MKLTLLLALFAAVAGAVTHDLREAAKVFADETRLLTSYPPVWDFDKCRAILTTEFKQAYNKTMEEELSEIERLSRDNPAKVWYHIYHMCTAVRNVSRLAGAFECINTQVVASLPIYKKSFDDLYAEQMRRAEYWTKALSLFRLAMAVKIEAKVARMGAYPPACVQMYRDINKYTIERVFPSIEKKIAQLKRDAEVIKMGKHTVEQEILMLSRLALPRAADLAGTCSEVGVLLEKSLKVILYSCKTEHCPVAVFGENFSASFCKIADD